MNLAAQQSAFCAWLGRGDHTIAPVLADPRGLAVYQNNYRGQLMACLAEAFPQTRGWLGDEAFAAAAATHVDTHPPISFTLDAYPESFVETLRRIWPDDAEIAELAMLEWQLAEAFVAADDPALVPEDLSRLDWDNAALQLVTSARVMPFFSNAPEIWLAMADEAAPPQVRIAAEPSLFIVWRTDFICGFRALRGAEAEHLPTLAKPRLFGALCEDLARDHGQNEAIPMAGEMLARWIVEGLVATVEH